MSNNHVIYEKEYLPFIIKWGRITNWTALVLCFSPALVLAVGFGLMPPFSAIPSGFLVVTSALVRGAHFLFSDHRRGRDIHGLRLRQHQQPPHPRVMPAKRWMGAWDGQGQHCRHAGHGRFHHRQGHHPRPLPAPCHRRAQWHYPRFRLDAYRCFRKHRHRDLFL